MSPVFATHRRAEEFEAVVDGRGPRGADDRRYDELLALVGALRAVPEPVPRPDFVTGLRERLVAEAAAMPARASTETDRLRLRTADPGRVRTRRERRVSIALGAAALVGATATLSVVAQTALPGDVLYPLKRGIENAHEGLSFGDGSKGDTLLASASTRLSELTQLAQRQADDRTAAAMADTLDDFTSQATEASDHLLSDYDQSGDQAAITELQTFAKTSMQSLDDLDGKIPPQAQDEWVHAVTTLVRIDDEARMTCPTCPVVDLSAVTPELPTVGTGFGTGALPAVNLPPITVPGLVLPTVSGSELPPGSVTKPTPSAGPGGGPTGLPTSLPTGLPSGLPTTTLPTSALPTSGSTGGVLPTDTITQLLDALTGGPIALPSVDVTQLLGGVGSILPTLPPVLPSDGTGLLD